MVVVIEVVDCLPIPEVHVVDVADPGGPLEVKEGRPDIFVFEPALFDQGFSEFMVASFDDEYLLVVATAVLPLPSLNVSDFLLPFLGLVVLFVLLDKVVVLLL